MGLLPKWDLLAPLIHLACLTKNMHGSKRCCHLETLYASLQLEGIKIELANIEMAYVSGFQIV